MNFKSSRGSVTLEATISLTAFMFAIVTVLTIVNICLVQAKISVAINTTAKEISQYSYLYGLTGFNESNKVISDNAETAKKSIDDTVTNVNSVFNEMQNLGQTGKNTDINDPKDVLQKWKAVQTSIDNGAASIEAIEQQIRDITKDPKQFIFGIASIAASEALEQGKSKLIAAPLSKLMVEKHLKSYSGQSSEDFLRLLHVVPGGNNKKYIDGLDFGDSTLFPNGSNEIRIVVKYKVKVLTLLPINNEFSFTQTAVTHGWLGGSLTYVESKEAAKKDIPVGESGPIWTDATVSERVAIIRRMSLNDMIKDKGYKQVKGLTDVHAYNSEKNNFVMISSMNPLYTKDKTEKISVDTIDEKALERSFTMLVGKIKSTTDGLKSVKVAGEDGKVISVDCANATNTIQLVIPQDPGLKEKMESVLKKMDLKGVQFEIVPSYGNAIKPVK